MKECDLKAISDIRKIAEGVGYEIRNLEGSELQFENGKTYVNIKILLHRKYKTVVKEERDD